MPNAFADLPAAPAVDEPAAPQPNAFADLPPQQPKANAFADLPSDDRLDPRSPNYDGPTISSAPTQGLLSRAYTAVREGLSPLIGPTKDQQLQRDVDAAFLKRALGVNQLPEADASVTKGLIPAAFENNTPWRLPDNAKAGDTSTKVVSNLLIPGLGGALASQFPNLAAAGTNSAARLANTLTSPGSLLTLGVGGELGAVAKGIGEGANLAKGVKTAAEGLFTADQARQLIGQSPETLKAAKDLVTGTGDTQQNIERLIDAGMTAFFTGAGGKAALSDVGELRSPASTEPSAKSAAPPEPGSLGTAPVDYVGNTNYLDPVTKSPARSELFRATQDIPELGLQKGGTVGRDRLESAGFSVPETPALDDGTKAQISAGTLAQNSIFPSLADSLDAARRGDVSTDAENARETALRQSPLSGLALAADLREGRTSIPEDVRARDFALARDEENRAATAQSLKDALLSNQIGQGENIQLAPDTTEGPPQNNILANLRLTDDLPEEEQFRRYLQSRAGTPPAAQGPLAGLQLKPLPDDAQITVQRYDTKAGPKQFTQIDIPNPDATGISDRVLASGDPAAIREAGYAVPDLSSIPEGQQTIGDLKGLKLLPDETSTLKENATQNRTDAQSDFSQRAQADRGGQAAEASSSDRAQQSRQVAPEPQKVVEDIEPGGGFSVDTDRAASLARERVRNLTDRIDDVNTDIGSLEQENNYTPPERWAPEDKAEYDRLSGVRDTIQKAIDSVSEKDYEPKVTGDAATDEGLREAAEEKPTPELDKKTPEGANPPDYKKPGIIAEFLSPLMTEIRRVSPEIAGRLMRYETRIRVEPQPYLRRLGEFYKATDGLLTTHEKAEIGNSLINGRFKEVENTIQSHAPIDPVGTKRALDAFTDSRAVLKELYDKAVASGSEVNELSQFWPREVVRDKFADFLKFLGADEKGAIRDVIKDREKDLARPLSDEEKVAIANGVVKNEVRAGITAKPGIFKERKIANVTKDLEPFYEDYKKSGVDYVNRVISSIEKRSLFGKNPQNIETSIGSIAKRLSDEGKLTGPMEDTLQKFLSDRFSVGETTGNRSLQKFKDLNFASILANPVSAVTQFINFAQSAMLNGAWNAIASTVGKREITMDDFGAHNIAQELQSRSGTAKFLNKAFDLSGFQKVDTIGKNNILNAALRQMRNAVSDTSSSAFKNFQQRYEPIYGSEFPQFVKDLQQGKVSENVKMAVFSRITDVHPVTLSEMPLKYLQNPNGRIFYQLRTFQIKQLDLFRREIFQQYKAGNTKLATSNLIRYGLYLTMAGAGTDLVKDLMLGREINPPDYVLANLLKLGGFTRYQLYNAYREGLGRAVADQITPSLGNALNPIDDLIHLDTIADDPLKSKTLRDVPIVGPFLYNWFGPGSEEGKTKIIGGKGLAPLTGAKKPHGLPALGGGKSK